MPAHRVDKQSAQMADSLSTRQRKPRMEGMEGTCRHRVDKQSAQMVGSVSTRQAKHRQEGMEGTCQHRVDKQSAQVANSVSTRHQGGSTAYKDILEMKRNSARGR